jgi:GTPase SAR1 family protein
LEALDISHNQLMTFPLFLSKCGTLKVVKLENNPFLAEIKHIEPSWEPLCAHYASLATDNLLCSQMKVLVLGETGCGKSTLCRNLNNSEKNVRKSSLLMSKKKVVDLKLETQEAETFGVEISDMSFDEDTSLVLKLWDFAPEVLKYQTFEYYLTGQNLFLVVFDVNAENTVDEFLSILEKRIDHPSVLLVATKKDKHPNAEAAAKAIFDSFKRRKKSLIHGYFCVDALRELPVAQIKAKMKKMALEMENSAFFGKTFPKSFNLLQSAVKEASLESLVPVMSCATFESIALACGVKAGAQISEALSFLHYMGAILYFGDIQAVSDMIIIDPFWICGVMHQLVNSVVVDKNGAAFLRSKMSSVFSLVNFPMQSHSVILQLLGAFDMIHELKSSKSWHAFVVPSMLSSVKSSFGEDEGISNFMQSFDTAQAVMRKYVFSNLPASLKTQILVRFLDVTNVHASIWANGVVCGLNEENANCKSLLFILLFFYFLNLLIFF